MRRIRFSENDIECELRLQASAEQIRAFERCFGFALDPHDEDEDDEGIGQSSITSYFGEGNGVRIGPDPGGGYILSIVWDYRRPAEFREALMQMNRQLDHLGVAHHVVRSTAATSASKRLES